MFILYSINNFSSRKNQLAVFGKEIFDSKFFLVDIVGNNFGSFNKTIMKIIGFSYVENEICLIQLLHK